ncbi:MAG: hypothetical protein WCL32_08080, partial [Planctomycetota bacterium]
MDVSAEHAMRFRTGHERTMEGRCRRRPIPFSAQLQGDSMLDLSMFVAAKVPVLLWGPPGIGKTQRWLRLAKSLKRPIHVLIASIRDPTQSCSARYLRLANTSEQ